MGTFADLLKNEKAGGRAESPKNRQPIKIKPPPKVTVGDVLREVPGATAQVAKETAKGFVRAPIRAGINAYNIVRSVAELARGNVGEANRQATATRKIPFLGQEKPVTGPVEAAGVGLDIGLTLAPSLRGVKGLNTPMSQILKREAVIDKNIVKAADSIENTVKQVAPKGAKYAPELLKTTQPEVKSAAAKQFLGALKEADVVRAAQEKLYTAERGKRISEVVKVRSELGGEKGFYGELSKLKGKLPKKEYESIRSRVTPEIIDNLFNEVKQSTILTEWDKLPAQTGLAKMFGELGGGVPTEGELRLLGKVFGEEFVQKATENIHPLQRVKDAFTSAINVPKSLMASFDMSAPFRQGIFLTSKPKQFWPAFVNTFKYFGSEKAYRALMDDINSRPTATLMKDSGLAITDIGKGLEKAEEQFISNWAEKIPLVGKGVHASNRAYAGFLNKVRADVFDDMVKKAELAGLNIADNQNLTKGIAEFINKASGRGTLPGSLGQASVMLNNVLFSPRLIASRVSLLTDLFNPSWYIKTDPFVRKEAMKSYLAFTGMTLTALGLAKAAGADVGVDPTSANFGKIKFGNTRYDVLGGIQQYIRLGAQLMSGKITSSTTGKEMKLGEGYKATTRYDILLRFLEAKEAPVVAFATQALKGKSFTGDKFNVPEEIANRFIPLWIQDTIDTVKEWGPKGLGMSIPAIFGVGVQTYGGPPQKPTSKTSP